jgi:hypothetical protein
MEVQLIAIAMLIRFRGTLFAVSLIFPSPSRVHFFYAYFQLGEALPDTGDCQRHLPLIIRTAIAT